MKKDVTLLHFLEIDMGSERTSGKGCYTLSQKMEKYIGFFDSGDYQKDFDLLLNGFRVLVICQEEKRLQQILKLCRANQADFIWLSLVASLKNPLGKHWFHCDEDGPSPLVLET